MNYKNLFALPAATLVASMMLSPAQAQQGVTPEQMQMAYSASRNQLGILEYCKGKGYAQQSTIDLQTKMITMMFSTPPDAAKGDEAEAQGKQGNVYTNPSTGETQSIAAAAKTQGVTEEKICTAITNAIDQAGAMLPK